MPPAPRRRGLACGGASTRTVGGREAGATAVLVEAVAEVGPRVERPAPALEVGDRCLRVERLERVERVAHRPIDDDARRVQPIIGIDRHEVLDGPGSACSRFMWYVIARASLGWRQSCWSTFQDAQAPARRGMSAGVGVEDDAVRSSSRTGRGRCVRERRRRAGGSAHRRHGSPGRPHRRCRCEPVAVRTVTAGADPGDVHDRVTGADRVGAEPLA